VTTSRRAPSLNGLLQLLRRPSHSTLAQLLRTWHGDPPSAARESTAVTPDFVPEPLRAFYRAAASWPEAVVQNRLLAPDELRLEGGQFVFYVENQATHLWATAPYPDDPQVWVIENERGALWEKEHEPLSRFLLQVALFEAVMGAEISAFAAWLDPPAASPHPGELSELPFAPWRWPDYPTRFYARDGVLAVVAPNRTPESGDDVPLYVAAKEEPALRFLEQYVDEAWETTPWD
jgi:hypothetical protein